jgi:2-phospho-L-lactate guanylyltransferase
MTAAPAWHLVVPVKGGTAAKSRLHPPPGVRREDLALALASDCLAACGAGMPAGRLLVVTSDARAAEVAQGVGAVVVPDPGDGLDAAVRAGVALVVSAAGPRAPVAVLLGDLPALRAGDLTAALGAAAAYPLAVVPDAHGEGTVLLTALEADRLVPRFGAGSAARHEAGGHHRLDLDLPRLRTDVDDDTSLGAAVRLGVGPASAAVLDGRATLPGMQASVHTFDEDSGAGSVLLDDGREVPFDAEVFAVSALRHVRPGQRLSIEVDGDPGVVSRLWLVGVGDDQTIG